MSNSNDDDDFKLNTSVASIDKLGKIKKPQRETVLRKSA